MTDEWMDRLRALSAELERDGFKLESVTISSRSDSSRAHASLGEVRVNGPDSLFYGLLGRLIWEHSK